MACSNRARTHIATDKVQNMDAVTCHGDTTLCFSGGGHVDLSGTAKSSCMHWPSTRLRDCTFVHRVMAMQASAGKATPAKQRSRKAAEGTTRLPTRSDQQKWHVHSLHACKMALLQHACQPVHDSRSAHHHALLSTGVLAQRLCWQPTSAQASKVSAC